MFGFAQTEFVGAERGENYEVQVGFLSGRPEVGGTFSIQLSPGTAGKGSFPVSF